MPANDTPAAVDIWLPALDRFGAAHPLRPWLDRSDPLADGSRGYLAGLADYFSAGMPLPAAALTRQWLCGDAGAQVWLSADPAWVQPDINGARLLACGHLGLDADEAIALADTLRPVFAEAGMQLEISSPDRWHLRLPAGLALPDFAAPEQALGEDLFQHLPQGELGRSWRVLLNETQILLHQHPLNAARRARGAPPINSLWLWGGGALPERMTSDRRGVVADDVLLRALAKQAGSAEQARTLDAVAAAGHGWLVDLQDLPADEIAVSWWPALQAAATRQSVRLVFASGERRLYKPWHRWRFWRGTRR